MTSDLHSGKARLNDAGDEPSDASSSSHSFPSGLNGAVLALQDYCNELENRVVSHFDRCTDSEDDEGMHQYATIMAKLDKEMILAQVTLKFTLFCQKCNVLEIYLLKANVHRYKQTPVCGIQFHCIDGSSSEL